jgi:hypothetical protein
MFEDMAGVDVSVADLFKDVAFAWLVYGCVDGILMNWEVGWGELIMCCGCE